MKKIICFCILLFCLFFIFENANASTTIWFDKDSTISVEPGFIVNIDLNETSKTVLVLVRGQRSKAVVYVFNFKTLDEAKIYYKQIYNLWHDIPVYKQQQ